MAFFDRIRDRMAGQRPVGAAGGMQQQAQDPFADQPLRVIGPVESWAQRGRENVRHLQHNDMSEEQVASLASPRTAEESDAYMLGRKMGARSLMEMHGQSIPGAEDMQAGRIMTRERLNSAMNTLLRYRSGKASVNRRVVIAQEWWKLNNWQQIHQEKNAWGTTDKPINTGWLWNCIVGKHADAIDSYPEPIILPRSEEDKEEAARLSKIVPVVMEMNDFEETYNDCSWQKMQEGTGVYGVFWDSTKLNGLGDISLKKVNILNLYWEPGIADIQESKNVFFVSYEDAEDVEAMYPETAGTLSSAKLFIEKYKTDDPVDLSNKVVVVDWYYKKRAGSRTVLHYCKFVGEYCIYSSEESGLAEGYYADGQYPFVLDPLFPVEGSPGGYGYIDIGKEEQIAIDMLTEAMTTNAVMRATPRYFSRKDGSVNESEFMDWRKKLVHVSGNLGQDALRPVEVNQMGSDAHNMLAQLIDAIKFITGNTDVQNGGVPTGVTAASAIAALKEDSGRSSKDSTKAAYRSYRKIVIMVIERIRQFYDIQRQFRILGQDGQEEFVNYSNAGLRVQQIPNLPGQDPGLRLPVFDIEVRAQRENAYTKMSQNELALQFWSTGLLNPQMTDQALMTLDMMDFRGKEELRKKIQAQGTLQEALAQVGQIALALAERYDPAVAMQLSGILQGISMDIGAAGIASGSKSGILSNGRQSVAGQLAPDDAGEAPRDARENGIVRNARDRAANASRPN